jgi:hypothetical protein
MAHFFKEVNNSFSYLREAILHGVFNLERIKFWRKNLFITFPEITYFFGKSR